MHARITVARPHRIFTGFLCMKGPFSSQGAPHKSMRGKAAPSRPAQRIPHGTSPTEHPQQGIPKPAFRTAHLGQRILGNTSRTAIRDDPPVR
ncbi:hypothetical protein GXY_15412 [Novacetimonas hansenii ATCC 23769]|uniref:Uncharacterized protein n=1 Tax=Novacetimonas hansenii ATCC 23769 TaxID=714995 RepID=D5QIV1_NOVHA|nr:hypothetical protein GXY_15412 [Novacetimonas hansenii ATCC 23769]